ncbi:aspartate aminotransferase [Bacteroidia bacterium]|nr:aspartate aminotransferase [Bacteroidia bacterium]
MKNTPIDYNTVISVIESFDIKDFGQATIREVVAIVNKLEALTGQRFVRMEMGVPGLPPAKIGTNAEIAALQNGIAAVYPMLDGLPELKTEASRFIKAFIDIDVEAAHCIPVVGSMQGTYVSFLVACQANPQKNKVLFIDPGFPVQKQQLRVQGYPFEAFDVYDFRGEKLKDKLEEYLKKGDIAAIIYSNPNNPAWISLNESELEIIGTLATKYDTIVLEDLAYFAMDFRKDLSKPFQAPFQSSVARYTDNYIILVSGSKVFSYAGQRIGVIGISDKLYERHFDGLKARYGVGGFGNVLVNRVLYALSSGTCHSAQYALAAMFKAANNGEFNFLEDMKEYARRAERMKKIFIENGFQLVYEKDLDEPIGDGFYFTLKYKNLSGSELMKELIFYGISAISLDTTGSCQQGLRACTSFIKNDQYDDLEERLKRFAIDH